MALLLGRWTFLYLMILLLLSPRHKIGEVMKTVVSGRRLLIGVRVETAYLFKDVEFPCYRTFSGSVLSPKKWRDNKTSVTLKEMQRQLVYILLCP